MDEVLYEENSFLTGSLNRFRDLQANQVLVVCKTMRFHGPD